MGSVRLTDLSWEMPGPRADVDVPLHAPFMELEPEGWPDPLAGPGPAEFDMGLYA
jgi:hypothetical protein